MRRNNNKKKKKNFSSKTKNQKFGAIFDPVGEQIQKQIKGVKLDSKVKVSQAHLHLTKKDLLRLQSSSAKSRICFWKLIGRK
jgi:hypothetical protein